MRLGTKLLLAFFLLAVLPLSWITIHSYNSSIAAFRKAVEAESGGLAEDMGRRMETMKGDLANRVERLSRFPFRQLMAVKGEKVDSQSNPLMAQLMADIGDAAPLVDSIEFNATPPETPAPKNSSAKAMPAAARVSPARPRTDVNPQQLVIQLSPEIPAPSFHGTPSPAGAPRRGPVMHFMPGFGPGPKPDPTKPPSAEDLQKMETRLRQIREFQVVLEQMDPEPDPRRFPPGTRSVANRPAGTESPAPAEQRPVSANRDFRSDVRAEGNTIGTVRARVSSTQMYRRLLSGGRRYPGEIAFVFDADHKLHTLSASDEKTLSSLDLPAVAASEGKDTPPAAKDWVVVTRKDGDSNVTFGIARPISASLRDIRNTAVRNLFYGLGMVGLALIGIIPLSLRMTRNLEMLTSGAEQLARGDLDMRLPVRSRDEIGRLTQSFNHMAHELREHQKQLVEQERMRNELELSRKIQEELLPKAALQSGRIKVEGVSIPAREVGGDFFNYFPLPSGEVALLVADVSGKGVAAALLMANLQATLRARLPLVQDLARLSRELDREIHASTPSEVYLTLFMCILSPAADEMRYVNAGHNTQFIIHASGRVDSLASTGRPLGLLPGGDYLECRIPLATDDLLFLYTDGLVEANDSLQQEFGQARLETLLTQMRAGSPGEILARIREELQNHRGAAEAEDDATILALKIASPAQSGN
jgi:serine phosphatase RsbU (regulator of sigma subunit)